MYTLREMCKYWKREDWKYEMTYAEDPPSSCRIDFFSLPPTYRRPYKLHKGPWQAQCHAVAPKQLLQSFASSAPHKPSDRLEPAMQAQGRQ